MVESCDCLIACGDDPWLADGRVQPCAYKKKRDADQARAVRRVARVNRLLLELGYPGDVAGALEELQRLRRNEYICIKCSLRKDGEHDRPADF